MNDNKTDGEKIIVKTITLEEYLDLREKIFKDIDLKINATIAIKSWDECIDVLDKAIKLIEYIEKFDEEIGLTDPDTEETDNDSETNCD